MNKKQQAKALIDKAKELGSTATVEENFVVFRPPLPVSLMMDAATLSDELAELLSPNAGIQPPALAGRLG